MTRKGPLGKKLGRGAAEVGPDQYPGNQSCQQVCPHIFQLPVSIGAHAPCRDHGQKRAALRYVLSETGKKHHGGTIMVPPPTIMPDRNPVNTPVDSKTATFIQPVSIP